MKKIICLLFIAIIATAKIYGFPKTPLSFIDPRATFHKMWVDYDITEDGVKGMRLHVKFTTYDMLNMDAYLAVYFLYNEKDNKNVLKDNNSKYNSTAGDVAVYKSIKPSYNPAEYDDMQLFMPYSELDLSSGTYNLTMDVKIIRKEGGTIQKLTKYNFEYTKPTTSQTLGGSSTEPDATLKKIWIDYDVTENGKKGMRIHVNFSLYNLKGEDCYLAIYFEKKNGDKLYGTSSEFRSENGQAAVYKSLKPNYDDAVYDDAKLFMPYSEFNLPKGKTDLKLDADVIYKNGDMVKHLDYQEFWYKE